jgi:tripartite-type tricarboxylate transporter receptor subunit TctC
MGRTVAQKLGERLGQQFVVDNRAGVGGNIGMALAARAPSDGYTLVTGSAGNLAINPTLYRKLPYDAIKDFAPISMGAWFANILVVHPSVPAKSVKEFIRLAKSEGQKLNYASAGVGSPNHLAAELFKSMTGVQMVHVPYKGAPPAVADVVGGHVPLMFSPLPTALVPMKSGRLRALGVTSTTRVAALPQVPTIAESGLPGFEAIAWNGVLAPAGTPREIIAKLSAEIVSLLNLPDVKERLSTDGSVAMGSTPEAFAAFIRSEMVKWGKVIVASGARAD